MPELAKLYNEKKFYCDGTNDILKAICKNGYKAGMAIDKVIFRITGEEIELIADELIYEDNGPTDPHKRYRYRMGLAMRKYRGAIPGKLLREKIINRIDSENNNSTQER